MTPLHIDTVAWYICNKSGWEVSNRELQKLMYLAQLIHLGKHDVRLFDGQFQAWVYGPVLPELYRQLRRFGARAIPSDEDVFPEATTIPEGAKERDLLDAVCDTFLPLSAADLVRVTHWHKGAWAKRYKPGVLGVVITDADIKEEYSK